MDGLRFSALRYKNDLNIKVDFKFIKFIGFFRWLIINQQKKDPHNLN